MKVIYLGKSVLAGDPSPVLKKEGILLLTGNSVNHDDE